MNTSTKIINYVQQNRALQHVLYWITILILSVPKGMIIHQDPFHVMLVVSCCVLVSQILASYCLGYYVIPRFLLKNIIGDFS